MNGQNSTKFCIHIIIDKIFVGILKRHFFSANLQQSNNPCLNSEFGQPWTAELAALDQLDLLLTRELLKNTCLFSVERSLPFGLLVCLVHQSFYLNGI